MNQYDDKYNGKGIKEMVTIMFKSELKKRHYLLLAV